MQIQWHYLTLLYLLWLLFLRPAAGQAARRRFSSEEAPSTRANTTLEVEKNALLAFKENLSDPNNILGNWTEDTDPCLDRWPGIECSSTSRVTIIDLPDFGLEGKLPKFSDLEGLMEIKMPNNSLHGSLPEDWHSLRFLQTIDLSRNNLSGNLPLAWLDCPSLSKLYLNWNGIKGELPPDWWLLPLEVLALSGNQLEGSLPSNWGNLAEIEVLDLSGNNLLGPLPKSWGGLDKLRVLWLSNNSVFGPLPETWSQLSNLKDLRLDHNNLVGELPEKWRFLLSTTNMLLNNNNLLGKVPEDWSRLSQHSRIDLSSNPHICAHQPKGSLLAKGAESPGIVFKGTSQGHCPSVSAEDTQALLQFKANFDLKNEEENLLEDWKWKGSFACEDAWTGIDCQNERVVSIDLSGFGISGIISEKLSTMSALNELKLEENAFHGVLPPTWGQLSSLKHLNLSANQIGGALPEEWSQLRNLEELDVSKNKIVGELPEEWSSLRNLKSLKLSKNTIDGPLPYAWSNLKSIEHLYLQQNILTGGLPWSWSDLNQLSELDVAENDILGPIPQEWSELKSLKVLSLRGNERLCRHEGSVAIPPQEASVKELLSQPCQIEVLEGLLLVELKSRMNDPKDFLSLWKAGSPPCLSSSAPWPGVLCQQRKVIGLDLTGFHLKDPFPIFTAKLDSIEQLQLADNEFVGTLPASWSELEGLKLINVSYNALNGSLPDTWGQLKSLEILDISHTNLQGSIPSEWSEMVNLHSLNASGTSGLCGGVPKDLSKNSGVQLVHENSTFIDSCKSGSDSSYDISVITILLSVFIVLTLTIWMFCFCCCCYQRKQQRQKLLEMVTSSFSRNKTRSKNNNHSRTPSQAPKTPSHLQLNGNYEDEVEDLPGTSEPTTRTNYAGHSISYRSGVANLNRYPPPQTTRMQVQRQHGKPFSPAVFQPIQSTAHRYQDVMLPMSGQSHPTSYKTTITRYNTHSAGIKLPIVETTLRGIKETESVGNVVSSKRIGSLIDFVGATTRDVPMNLSESQESNPVPRSAFEVSIESQGPSSSTPLPQQVSNPVERLTAAKPITNPRRIRSKIPKAPAPSVCTSLGSQSSSLQSSDYTIKKSKLKSVLRSHEEEDGTLEEQDVRRNEESWDAEQVPVMNVMKRPSPSTEMFRWLESYQQTGTFDLDDLSLELFTRTRKLHSAETKPGIHPLAQRFSVLNVANLDVEGIHSSTKELLFWLESRIDEVKRVPVAPAKRGKPARSSWAPTESALFNYKTSSTLTES